MRRRALAVSKLEIVCKLARIVFRFNPLDSEHSVYILHLEVFFSSLKTINFVLALIQLLISKLCMEK